jgi:hypothetical protein
VTADEYFDHHIPYRVNLLIAFRTRYSEKSPHVIDPETYRDLFRCAKDICFLMTRFFCGELGFYFDEKSQQMEAAEKWIPRFGSSRAYVSKLRANPRYLDLCLMYKAANQAIAHMDKAGVDHLFRNRSDNQRMVAVIDWLEELIREHIYIAAGRDLKASMALAPNVMLSR